MLNHVYTRYIYGKHSICILLILLQKLVVFKVRIKLNASINQYVCFSDVTGKNGKTDPLKTDEGDPWKTVQTVPRKTEEIDHLKTLQIAPPLVGA